MARCDECGRFVGYKDVDEYTHFDSTALVPPDPITVCGNCSLRNENKIVSTTKAPARPHMPWRPARFHYRAIARLGMVLACPRGAAWRKAYWPGQVPVDYEMHELPASVMAELGATHA